MGGACVHQWVTADVNWVTETGDPDGSPSHDRINVAVFGPASKRQTSLGPRAVPSPTAVPASKGMSPRRTVDAPCREAAAWGCPTPRSRPRCRHRGCAAGSWLLGWYSTGDERCRREPLPSCCGLPACCGLGGTEPTVTDANLALERLGAGLLLGGGMAIDLEPARRAIHDRLAGPL